MPAMILTDTVARMVKGVLSDDVCFEDESIYGGLLEYPQYTRPPVYRGLEVPEVLMSGNTAKKMCIRDRCCGRYMQQTFRFSLWEYPWTQIRDMPWFPLRPASGSDLYGEKTRCRLSYLRIQGDISVSYTHLKDSPLVISFVTSFVL